MDLFEELKSLFSNFVIRIFNNFLVIIFRQCC